jgi:tRNA-binding EMAP/Myf-like protein
MPYMQVECGFDAPRTIVSKLAMYVSAEELVGRKVVVLCNLNPSRMRGIQSYGVLLAARLPKTGEEEEGAQGAQGAQEVQEGAKELRELLVPPADSVVGELLSVVGYESGSPDEMLKSRSALAVRPMCVCVCLLLLLPLRGVRIR